mgnify:CR=1 FL=1
MSEDTDGAAIRYVPAVAAEWDLDTPDALHRELDATMCFVDISGFTNLSEKLAARGRIGAEELTEVLRRVFVSMISLAHQRGGNLVKFGGDALLLLFRGDGHVAQACGAAVEMPGHPFLYVAGRGVEPAGAPDRLGRGHDRHRRAIGLPGN